MAAIKLSPLEARLVDAAERGQPLVPTDAELNMPTVIRSEVIRAMLLGTGLSVRGRLLERDALAPTRYGIRIHWPGKVSDPDSLLRIVGDLDLRDIAAGESGFLPPLKLQGCLFEGSIDLSGAHIQSLRLVDCRFASLRAEAARFAGSVRMRHCGPRASSVADFGAHDFIGYTGGAGFRPAVPPREVEFGSERTVFAPTDTDAGATTASLLDADKCCEVFLRAATIGAGLEIEKCWLRARRIQPATVTRSMRDVSALELSHAHVRDRVELVRSTFVGGARFVGAQIGDDVWILGGKFLALANRYALDFQFARIAGQLGVKGDNASEEERKGRANAFFPVIVIGQFSAIGLSAGEVWIAGGFFHGHDHDEQGASPTLNFSKCDIRRTFKLGLYHPHYINLENRRGDRVYVHGELCLIATNIGKNLEIHGVRAADVYDELGLDSRYDAFFEGIHRGKDLFKIGGEALKVDRRVNVTHSAFCAGTDRGETSEEERPAAISWAATSAVDLFKATIGTGLKITPDCRCEGAVRINSCVIGREAIIGCKIIGQPPAYKGQDRGVIPWLLDMRESVINGHLKIGRRETDDEAVRVAGGISLESAKVRGNAALRRLTLDLSSFRIEPDRNEQPNDRDRTALNLRDFVCGSEFEVHRLQWVLPPLRQGEGGGGDDESPAAAAGAWAVPPWRKNRKRYFDIEKTSYASIDMRGFRCGLLSDDFGDGWGLTSGLRLRLASFHVEEVEAGSDERVGRIGARLRWLTYQNRMQRIPIGRPSDPELPERLGWLARQRREWVALWERNHCSRGDDFVRHAYDVVAAANGRAGEERAAEEIIVERKNIQATLRFARSRDRAWDGWAWFRRGAWLLAGITLFVALSRPVGLELKLSSVLVMFFLAVVAVAWPACLAVLQLIARYGFRYGFSFDRALVVLVFCIGMGAFGVHWARYGGLVSIDDWADQTAGGTKPLNPAVALVLEVPYAPSQPESGAGPSGLDTHLLPMDPEARLQMRRNGGTRSETSLVYAKPSPCNVDVSSVLYAADVFIPVLDLEQESRCSIRHFDPYSGRTYTGWRILKALYELLGWVVTSLVILILGGVLRRDLERRISADAAENSPGEG